eukprot:scaffold383761_cov212-Cyclotella_meneghiniana.AAC.1
MYLLSVGELYSGTRVTAAIFHIHFNSSNFGPFKQNGAVGLALGRSLEVQQRNIQSSPTLKM